MNVAVQLAPPLDGRVPTVAYRWDADTEILTATVAASGVGEGLSGSIGVEGRDGSWLVLDVSAGRIRAGRIRGVEVAVWPDLRRRPRLAPPADVESVAVSVPARRSQPGIAAFELSTHLIAESDVEERTIHFRIGRPRPVRTVALAQDILLDVDPDDYLAGVWLLNVPPSPTHS